VGVSAILPFAASSRFILVVYGDTSLHVLDLQAAQIIRHQIGHFAPLAQVVPHPHPSLTHVVFTTSADQSIGVWQAHQSSRLSVRFVDLPALSDSAAPDTKRSYLSSNAALTGSSQGSIAALAAEGLPAMATALALHPSGCFVGIGDLHGRVRLFQVSKPPPAHAFAASSTMNRTKAQQQQPAFTPTVSEFTLRAAADFVDGSEVTALAFAGGEGHLMAACQRNGALVVCEVGPPIRLLRTVYQARKNTPAAPAFQTVIFLKGASEWQVDAANTHYLLCVAPDSRGIQLLTFSRLSAHRTEVAVVSEMRLQTSTANANNVASNERVSGVSVHPSENYALVSTNAGRVFVFHLQTGECRGIIKTPAASCGQCVIDPSGLYLAVLASTSGKTSPTSVILPPNSLALTAERAVMSLTSSADAVAASTFDEHAEGQVPKMSLESMVPTALRLAGVSLAANAQQPPNSDTSAASVDSSLHMTAASKYTRVLLYEVGTGKYIDEIAQPLGVSHAAFAGNGQAIFVASLNGSMSMFKLKTELAENVRHVMASMTATPYFWSRFPIYLPKATADAVKAPMDFDEDSGASNDLLGGDSNELVPDAPVDEMPEEEQTRRSQSAFDTQRLNKTATNSFGSRAPRSPSVFRQQTAPQQASQPNRRNLNNSNNFQDEFDEESDPFARSMRSEDFSRSRTGPLFNDNGRAERAAAFLADDDDQFMQPMHQQSQQQFSRIPSGFGGDPYDDQQLREQEYHNENTPNGLQGLYAVGSKAPLRHEDDDNMSQASYRSDHIVPMQRPTKEATLTKPPRGVSVFGSRPPQQFDDNASIGDPSALDDFNDNHSQYEQEEFQVHRPGKSVKQQQPSAQFQPKQIAANRAPVSGAPSRRPAQRYAAEDSDGEDGGLEISAPPVPHTREEAAELMRAAMESDSAPVSHVLEDEFAAQQHYQQPMGRPKTATGKQKAMSPAAIKSPKHHFGGNGGRNEESADMAVSYTVRREIDADADGLDEDDEGQSALGALDDFESRLSRLQPVEEPKKAAPAEEVQPQESAAPVDGAEQPAGDAAPADGAAAAEGQPEAAAEPAADGAPAADAPPAEAPADAPPAEEAAPAAE
jgi:WD40 repeat protein